MSRIHDMGGRLGDGPIAPEPPDAPAFDQDWHGRALALTLAAGALGQWNLDRSRFARESLPPGTYMGATYYEKWIAGLADLLVAQGVITPEELAGGTPMPSELAARRLPAEAVEKTMYKGGPTSRDGATPRFKPGDRVKTLPRAGNRQVPGGHTRLPAYAAGLIGEVVLSHGPHILPDANAHGLGECPEPLYTVVFDAGDVWGTPERAGDEVTCDLWESYLDSAE